MSVSHSGAKNSLKNRNIQGTLASVVFCVLSICSILFPVLQMAAIFSSIPVLNFVRRFMVDAVAPDHCYRELSFVCALYFSLVFITTIAFFIYHAKKDTRLVYFIVFLLFEFILLQVPFFIFEVGTYYNCESDGQTLMGVLFSSWKVSLLMVIFGITYDLVKWFKMRERPSGPV